MNEIIEKETKIENMIYEIRGVEVMLDSDLAKLYECVNGTKTINQAVKRHLNKFPERYMFQLDKNEYEKLRSQVGTLEIKGQGQYSKYLPFVYMRKYLSNDSRNAFLINHESRILKLEESFDKFSNKDLSIINEGKIYDAYSIMINIFNDASEEIIIIDNML